MSNNFIRKINEYNSYLEDLNEQEGNHYEKTIDKSNQGVSETELTQYYERQHQQPEYENDNTRKSETASVQERDGEKSIGRGGRGGRDGRAVNSSRSGKTIKGPPTRQKVKGSEIELIPILFELNSMQNSLLHVYIH